VSLQDLADLKDETFLQEKNTTTITNITYEEAIQGRQELVALLQDAGVTNIDVPTLLLLPTWETVKKLYGDAPVVYGLDQCSYYQQTIPKNDASLGVAGIFNTGTNLLAMYLSANCRMPENPQRNHGMRWQGEISGVGSEERETCLIGSHTMSLSSFVVSPLQSLSLQHSPLGKTHASFHEMDQYSQTRRKAKQNQCSSGCIVARSIQLDE
jgi:hypothetical protein